MEALSASGTANTAANAATIAATDTAKQKDSKEAPLYCAVKRQPSLP